MTSRAKDTWIMGLILGMVALAFTSALTGDPVFDDQLQLVRNPTLQDLGNVPKMFTQSVWQFTSQEPERPSGAFYRPIFNILLILNYHLFGLHLFWWHIFSLVLHLLATLLVYLLSRRWGLSPPVAAIATLLFGLHPVHVESVAWISAFPDPLIAVFILWSILLYECYYRSESSRWYLLATSLLLALAAMFTKEIGVMLPVFLAVSEWIHRSEGESVWTSVGRISRRVTPFAVVAVVYLAARYAVLGFITQSYSRTPDIGVVSVLLTIPRILLSYLRLLVCPFPLSYVYDEHFVRSAADPRFWGSLIVLGCITVLLCRVVRSSGVALRALSLAIFLFPALNLAALNPYISLMHDRYLYLPSVGVCLLAGLGSGWLIEHIAPNRRRILVGAGSVVFFLLSWLTFAQNQTWRNDLALNEHAVRWYPRQAFAFDQLGLAYLEENRFAEAEQSLRKAVSLQPESYTFQFDLAYFLGKANRYDEAAQWYEKAIALGDNAPFVFFNLGVAYLQQGKLDEAESRLQRAIELLPSFAEALYNVGWINERRGALDLAEKQYLDAIKQKPSYADPYIGLARIYGTQGRFPDAGRQLQTVLDLEPENPAALFELGGLYYRTGHCPRAIPIFEELVDLQPQHPSALTFLGLSYECAGEMEKAKGAYQKAILVVPDAPNTKIAHEHLAALAGQSER